jgi:hypothetical protein
MSRTVQLRSEPIDPVTPEPRRTSAMRSEVGAIDANCTDSVDNDHDGLGLY